MPRQARLDAPGILHHVMVRGIEGCPIFQNGGQRREVSRLRAKISSHLSHELGIPMAEIARHVGVCGSAVIKAIQKMESADQDS